MLFALAAGAVLARGIYSVCNSPEDPVGEVFTILHIGDSHVQAGVWTGRMRELLQAEYGNAGRGLIVPHRLAGMNEARDYAITTGYKYHTTTGATGVEVEFDVPMCEFRIWSREPFDRITVLHGEGAPMLYEDEAWSTGMYCNFDNTDASTHIALCGMTDSLVLGGFSHGDEKRVYRGFILENGGGGVLYHAVGLNGASFETFAGAAKGGLKVLEPDMIIVSLGTNNCFGSNFREGDFYNIVDGFVRDLKENYAGVPILLTTPMEACRKRVPNPNIAVAARVICEVAEANDVAWWDFYTAAGGKGAMAKWHAEGWAANDRIHLTTAGYERQADMFFQSDDLKKVMSYE